MLYLIICHNVVVDLMCMHGERGPGVQMVWDWVVRRKCNIFNSDTTSRWMVKLRHYRLVCELDWPIYWHPSRKSRFWSWLWNWNWREKSRFEIKDENICGGRITETTWTEVHLKGERGTEHQELNSDFTNVISKEMNSIKERANKNCNCYQS